MTGDPVSPQGRRVLVARVTGEAGERIQAWRLQHDPGQARRLPPHTTLCYWPPAGDSAVLEAQVRHAFPAPVTVHLGAVKEFDNTDHTFYVDAHNTATLDAARTRLYDGTHVALPGRTQWTWHVTCVRYGRERDLAALRAAAASLSLNLPWVIDTVAYLELRGDRYEPLCEWSLAPSHRT